MVGRNDPCICGSGKKYKKCCALKNEPSQAQLVEEELERIIIGYYENAMESSADVVELERYEKEWHRKLGDLIPKDEIQGMVVEYFLFVARRDLWNRYILKVLNGQVRPATRETLALWIKPIVLLGKITNMTDDYFQVEEVLGHETYTLKLEDEMDIKKGWLVLGLVLPDTRKHEDGVMILDGLTFINDMNGNFTKKFMSIAEASGHANSYDFFKAHLIDIYKTIADGEVNSVDDIADHELTPKQQEVITVMEDELEFLDLPKDDLEFTKMIAITYLVKENPAYRKPEMIAAAAVKVANDFGSFGGLTYSQAEIAEMFGVSVSAMKKHADKLTDTVHEIAEEMDGQNAPQFSYMVGTDPMATEVSNWEIYCKMDSIDFESLEDAQSYMMKSMNEPFQPKGKKQEAQAIAYEAYRSEDIEERNRLGKKVAALDSQNVDGVLLQIDAASSAKEAERLFQKAIALGEPTFDEESDNVWRLVTNRPYMRALFAYGVWLFEEDRLEESAKLFEKLLALNPSDNQGARYLAISAYIHLGEYEKADALLDKYGVESMDDAPYLFLEWLLEMSRTEGESEIGHEMFEDASERNPIVGTLLEEDLPRLPYPKQLAVTPGSVDEAMYIKCLL